MKIEVEWSPEVSQIFHGLTISIGIIVDIRFEKKNELMEALKTEICSEVRSERQVETLKDDITVRAYRDMYWRLNIDPTKIRPSGEALLRRVLRGNDLPTISTAVDAYNLASMKTIVPISGFDFDRLTPPFQIRFAREKESFKGIGMEKPLQLDTKMLVVADQKQVICIYPHRDSDTTKIVSSTRTAAIFGYGAPGTSSDQPREAVEMAMAFIKQVSGGNVKAVESFTSDKNSRITIGC